MPNVKKKNWQFLWKPPTLSIIVNFEHVYYFVGLPSITFKFHYFFLIFITECVNCRAKLWLPMVGLAMFHLQFSFIFIFFISESIDRANYMNEWKNRKNTAHQSTYCFYCFYHKIHRQLYAQLPPTVQNVKVKWSQKESWYWWYRFLWHDSTILREWNGTE